MEQHFLGFRNWNSEMEPVSLKNEKIFDVRLGVLDTVGPNLYGPYIDTEST